MWEVVKPYIQHKNRVAIERYKAGVKLYISRDILKKLKQTECKWVKVYQNKELLLVQFLTSENEDAKRISSGKISLPGHVVKDYWGNRDNGIRKVGWKTEKENLIVDLSVLVR